MLDRSSGLYLVTAMRFMNEELQIPLSSAGEGCEHDLLHCFVVFFSIINWKEPTYLKNKDCQNYIFRGLILLEAQGI